MRGRRTPADLERETGALRGAIYGAAPHGRLGTLRRPGPVVRGVDGLFRAGGTAHPGGGLPLVALGGRVVCDLIGSRGVNRTRWLIVVCAVPLLLVLGVLVSAGLGGAAAAGSDGPRFAPDGAERVDVGRGATGAAIFRPGERDGAEPVVVFLHGWAAVDPAFYGAWIDHLVRARDDGDLPDLPGAAVHRPADAAAQHDRCVARGIRGGAVARRRLVVAGHSAGGALAVDYAAPPAPPGCRRRRRSSASIPAARSAAIPCSCRPVDASGIAADTRVLVLAVRATSSSGRASRARSRAPRRTRERRCGSCATARVDDHAAPARSSPAARRAFWKPLDRLVDATG